MYVCTHDRLPVVFSFVLHQIWFLIGKLSCKNVIECPHMYILYVGGYLLSYIDQLFLCTIFRGGESYLKRGGQLLHIARWSTLLTN